MNFYNKTMEASFSSIRSKEVKSKYSEDTKPKDKKRDKDKKDYSRERMQKRGE